MNSYLDYILSVDGDSFISYSDMYYDPSVQVASTYSLEIPTSYAPIVGVSSPNPIYPTPVAPMIMIHHKPTQTISRHQVKKRTI